MDFKMTTIEKDVGVTELVVKAMGMKDEARIEEVMQRSLVIDHQREKERTIATELLVLMILASPPEKPEPLKPLKSLDLVPCMAVVGIAAMEIAMVVMATAKPPSPATTQMKKKRSLV